MKRSRGFTLIELMVTLSVAAILLAIGVPSFINVLVGNRLATQSNEIVSAFHIARGEAIKRNQPVRLCRAAGVASTTCAGAGVWEHWVILSATDTVIRRGELNRYGGSIGITSTLPGAVIVFGSDGLARTGGGMLANGESITVCADSGPTENMRRLDLGAGSRISTISLEGECEW
jgi:type IV fimbrial biogenesis protein FimT